MKKTTLLKISLLLIFTLLSMSVVKAQAQVFHEPTELLGQYSGMATTTETNKKTQEKKQGIQQQLIVEVGPDDNRGQAPIVFKNICVQGTIMSDIQVSGNLLIPSNGKYGHVWDVAGNATFNGNVSAKDGKTSLSISFKYKRSPQNIINADDNSMELHFEVDCNGTLTEYEFKGTKTTTTAISGVKTDKTKEDVIYDLQGRRVSKPAHGIYIINGRKVIM